MTCDLDRVDALADGRLDGPEAKEVMEHLAGCPQCRAYYEGALAADRVLAVLSAAVLLPVAAAAWYLLLAGRGNVTLLIVSLYLTLLVFFHPA